jgi:CheY-like chemotaxis protein
MPKHKPLAGARILVAEDNAIQALDLKLLLENAGAEVIGPAKTVAEVLALVRTPNLTCAVLDVVLRHEYVFPAARVLSKQGTAIIFYTGTFLESIRRDWPAAQVVAKPAPPELLLRATCAVAVRQ